MIETFLDEVCWKLRDTFSDMIDDFTKDSTGYVYVDGEEGDHGDILYTDADGKLIATHRIYGGDSDEYFFTEYGCDVLCRKIIEALPLAASRVIR